MSRAGVDPRSVEWDDLLTGMWVGPDAVADLRVNLRDAEEHYMNHVRSSALLGRGERMAMGLTGDQDTSVMGRHRNKVAEREARREALSVPMDDLSRTYGMMMAQVCFMHLRRGVTVQNLLVSASMSAAMLAVSPQFRQHTKDKLIHPLQDAIDDRINNKTGRGWRKVNEAKKEAERKADRYIESLREDGVDPDLIPDRASVVASYTQDKWKRREQALREAADAGRVPWTARSAALTEVALSEKLYSQSREPGADVEGLNMAHAALVDNLYREAARDGIEPEEFAQASRVVVGQRIQENPAFGAMYDELAHGAIIRSPERTLRVRGMQEPVSVWEGGFESRDGAKVTAGMFSVRPPMSSYQHAAELSDSMTRDLMSSRSLEDLNERMMSYAVGWAAAADPSLQDRVPAGMASRLSTARVSLQAMASDGVEPEQQQLAYTSAFVDSLRKVAASSPEIEAQWSARFGSDWESGFHEFIQDPKKMWAEHAASQRGHTHSRGSEQWSAPRQVEPSGERIQEPQMGS